MTNYGRAKQASIGCADADAAAAAAKLPIDQLCRIDHFWTAPLRLQLQLTIKEATTSGSGQEVYGQAARIGKIHIIF